MAWDDTLEVFYEDDPHVLAGWAEYIDNDEPSSPGWFYWFCFSGGDPIGPFNTEQEAYDDAESYYGDDDL